MKRCNKCGEMKPLTEFARLSNAPDGLRYSCRTCNSAAALAWNRANKARALATCVRYQHRNPHVGGAWRRANRARLNAYMSQWRKANKTLHSIRHVHVGVRPKWAINFFMRETYRLAGLRTRATGIRWEVDHIVPLNHPLVCGLHVETNLRIVSRFENRSKGNRHWPDMPGGDDHQQ